MNPTTGRIVHYVLTKENVTEINRRRVSNVGHGEDWPAGAQAHVGSEVHPGDILPMIVTAVWSNNGVDGQVFLNGNDTLWVTSVWWSEKQDLGRWTWPPIE